MTDRELLELAAKAAGMPKPFDDNDVWSAWVGSPESGHWWDPLTDDGDALRLAVKLGMNVEVNDNYVLACTYGNFSEPSKPDQLAAARRAITRAAAAMASNGETV